MPKWKLCSQPFGVIPMRGSPKKAVIVLKNLCARIDDLIAAKAR